MKLKILKVLLIISALILVFSIQLPLGNAASASLSVPYYSQPNWYYCGPAALEMVFDYYGPDISQTEIADAARTDGTFPDPFGTYTDEMRRAGHFSDLSTSAGESSTHVTGYTGRGLGYAAFVSWTATISDLESLIDAGYPVIVLQWNTDDHDWRHFRVVIGYDDVAQEITVHDPLPQSWTGDGKDTSWGGPNNVYSYSDFSSLWYMNYALVVYPWEVSLSSPSSVDQGNTFTVSATIDYPRPAPFTANYPASSCEATITLPAGLSLAVGETATQSIGLMLSGGSSTADWDVVANTAGPYTINVEAEGQVDGSVSAHSAGVFTTGYSYTDRIGGSDTIGVTVTDGVGVGTLQGTVTDADTGLPIMGATVSADGYSTTTDTLGFYSFPSVPEGSYDVTAEMTGYVSETASSVAVTADTITVQDFALSPVPAVPSIESSDSTGAKKDTFDMTDDVYATGTGYSPSTTYDLYIVEDVTWVDGMAIPPRVAGTTTTITSDASGNVPATLLWSNPLVVGKYDIVVDVDGDGLYYAESDALDDNDVEVTAGFFIIPEVAIGSIMAVAAMFAALGLFVYRKKHKPTK